MPSRYTKSYRKSPSRAKNTTFKPRSKPVGGRQQKQNNVNFRKNTKDLRNVRQLQVQQALNGLVFSTMSLEDQMRFCILNKTGYRLDLEPDCEKWFQVEQELQNDDTFEVEEYRD